MKILKKFPNIYITFCIYALIGWLYEVLWLRFAVEPHQWINRGVLFGPFLPIYGFGMLLLLFILHKFIKEKHTLEKNIYLIPSVLIVTTFIYTTIIEYTVPKIYNPLKYLTNYGIGLLIANIAVLIIVKILTKKFKQIKNIDVTIVLVFIIIWLITTALEYISHYFIDTFSHKILWDYSKDFLNVNRRINWDASRNFAIGGTILLYTVQPLIDKLLDKLSDKKKYIITLIISIPMLIDFIIRVIIK